MQELDIMNAHVSMYGGKVRYIHANLGEQYLETLQKLGRGNYKKDDYSRPAADYKLQEDITLILWQR